MLKKLSYFMVLCLMLVSNAIGADPASLDEALTITFSNGKMWAAMAGVIAVAAAIFGYKVVRRVMGA